MKTDICLILEGTYPYVHGGVSGWLHTLVSSMNDVTFSVVHLSSTGDVVRIPKYKIPPNILEFKEAFVHDFRDEEGKTFGDKNEGWDIISQFYKDIGNDDFGRVKDFYRLVVDRSSRRLNTHDLVFSRKGWDSMLELYNNVSPDVSFMDFYWTMRFIHIPILNLFNVELPDASVYHTICTGYAGLLAAIAKISRKMPMILTEHGIYTHERKIDISRASWIYSGAEETMRVTRSLGFFKDLWIKKFEILSKLTYANADAIITLFEGNRQMQIDGGADPKKTMVIPNGVQLPANVVRKPLDKSPKSVGFVGRVVSIKDIKTFIRAMKIVKSRIDDLKVYILGSSDEEPQYAEECKVLVKMLQLEDSVVFTGVVDANDYYPVLDVVALTSISEAQPLSILEAMSHGVPVVATDVGSCRELLSGNTAEDRSLGPSGIVTNVGSPVEIAAAAINILSDKKLHSEMSETGRERVKRYYDINKMIGSYRDIYSYYLKKSVAQKALQGAMGRA